MNNLALSEMTPLDSIVYRLEGYDPEGGNVTFGLIGSENFQVDAITGDVKLVKELDREVSELIFILFIIELVDAMGKRRGALRLCLFYSLENFCPLLMPRSPTLPIPSIHPLSLENKNLFPLS